MLKTRKESWKTEIIGGYTDLAREKGEPNLYDEMAVMR